MKYTKEQRLDIGRRIFVDKCTAERSEAGLAFFFCGEAATTTLNPLDL